jgi:hypothetical protein
MPTFETPQPIAITVDVFLGDVKIIASDRTDTVVEVRPSDAAKKEDVRAAQETEVDFAAGNLTVKGPRGWKMYIPPSAIRTPSIDVTIEVPAGSRLHGTAHMCRFLVTGELGQCELKNSVGGLQLEKAGPLELQTSGGNITVERPRGSVTAKTANGNIRIGDASRGTLRLETSAGELEVGIHLGSAAYLDVNTKAGTLQNLMETAGPPAPSEETVHVYARSSFGNIIIRHAIAV